MKVKKNRKYGKENRYSFGFFFKKGKTYSKGIIVDEYTIGIYILRLEITQTFCLG